jgi:methionyl-tRNA formyltransferase
MNTLLLVGNDKLSRKLVSQFTPDIDFQIAIDVSTNMRRVVKLLRRGSLSPLVLFKMLLAEFFRKDYPIEDFPKIRSNNDLLDMIRVRQFSKVYMFHVGLIINKAVISSGVEILNTHCASLPKYGGLMSIDRALKDHVFSQEATLHQVTEKIDSGNVIAVNPYLLEKDRSYAWNEDRAYNAGIELILGQLKKPTMPNSF